MLPRSPVEIPRVLLRALHFALLWVSNALSQNPPVGREYRPEQSPEGFYLVTREDCGEANQQPHKVRGLDRKGRSPHLAEDDPLLTYNVGDNWDRSVVYRFEGMNPRARFILRVALLSSVDMTEQITANREWLSVSTKDGPGFSIRLRAHETRFLEFDLPADRSGRGSLELRFSNREGWPAVVSTVELWADQPAPLAPVDNPPPLPPYQELAAGPWNPVPFENRPFFFLTYDKVSLHKPGSVHGRFAYEAEIQRVLTPVWKFEDFSLARDGAWAGVAEWGYGIALDGESKFDCYESRRGWFVERLEAARRAGKKFHSFTGHEWLEPYAALWGADRLTTELGAGSPCVQARVALVRGAARQRGIPFALQTSPWYGGKIPHYEDGEGEDVSRRGHSAPFQARTWYLAWLGGAAYVTPEACQLALFHRLPEQKGTKPAPPITPDQPLEKRFKLSPLGSKAQQFVRVIEAHPERGVPFTPFALILDQYSGFHVNPGPGAVRPWWRLEPTAGDLETATFLNGVFPGTILYKNTDRFSEARLMVNAPYGESFDLLLSDAEPRLLGQYPVAILLGDHALIPEFRTNLLTYLSGGGRVVLNQRLAGQLGPDLERFRAAGRVSIEEFARTGHSTHELMRGLVETHMPLRITGDVQYTVNRTAKGWIVGLIENKGAWREENGNMMLNPQIRPEVTITLKTGTLAAAREWVQEQDLPVKKNSTTLSVPGGEVRIVELLTR